MDTLYLNSLLKITLTKEEWKRLSDFSDEHQLRVCDVASAFIARRIDDLCPPVKDSEKDQLDALEVPAVVL